MPAVPPPFLTDPSLYTITAASVSALQVFRKNAGNTGFEFATLSLGATNLDGLSDVAITSVASGNVLYYNGTNFVNATPDAAGLVDKSSTQTGIAGPKTWTGMQTLTPASGQIGIKVVGVAGVGNLAQFTDTDGTTVRTYINTQGVFARGMVVGGAGQTPTYDMLTVGGAVCVQASGSNGFVRMSRDTPLGWNSTLDNPNGTALETYFVRAAANSVALRADSGFSVGPTFKLEGKSSTTSGQAMSDWINTWTVSTHASLQAHLVGNVYNFNGACKWIDVDAPASGTTPTITLAGALAGTSATFSEPVMPGTYTVATLPTVGVRKVAYASNGRKVLEGPGAGTGVLVFSDATAWIAVDTGLAVAA